MSPNDWDSRGYPWWVKPSVKQDLICLPHLIPLENYLNSARIFFYHILIPALLPHTSSPQLPLPGKWINQHECFTHYWALLHTFPGGSVVKNLPDNAGDVGSISRLVRSPGEENGNPLQCSCLRNPVGRGTWRATVHGAAKESDMT